MEQQAINFSHGITLHSDDVMVNFSEIEAKWQKAWEDAKIFESEIGNKESFMVAVAFPYVNAPQHIGHVRTFGTGDILARYKRSRGYNVLFPMGIHATGTPALAFSKRIKNKDQEIIDILKMFHVPEADIEKMVDEQYLVDYFGKDLEHTMRIAGYSIDWRRKFVTTENPQFSKFIEWQFGILQKLGYLVKGTHPVGWCTNENGAVGAHDTLHDMEPEIEEQTAIKFKVDDEEAAVLCSTYRPETIFAVTNIFISEDSKYVLCKVEGQKTPIYFSKAAAEILKYQLKLEVIKEIEGWELHKKRCINPVTGETVPILPGFFVKEKVGTGVVMSVPSHAPFDYAAIERLRAEGYDVSGIKPKKIIDVPVGKSLGTGKEGYAKPEHLDMPALAYLETLRIDANALEDLLESATKLEYKEESHWGKMLVPGYEGMSEPEAREKVKAELLQKGDAIALFTLQNAPIFCRCGTEIIVRLVEDQWFLNYGDESWKAITREELAAIRILPEKSRHAFETALEWIKLRPVARAQGKGTPLPVDRKYIIEPLSDSTIYMSYYTISNLVKDIGSEKLRPEFFDYVLLGKGEPEKIAQSTGIDYDIIRKCRESFAYWYVNVSNHSASEQIFSHHIMAIFNHAAIFEKKNWLKMVVANGMVLSGGEKMSKSLGNIVPLVDGAAKYGIDALRLNVLAGTDLYSDADFSEEAVRGIQERLSYLHATALGIENLEAGELRHVDYWLYSMLNRKISEATKAMDAMELRDAYTHVLYNSILELRRYFARGGCSSISVKDYISSIAIMLQPIAPHFAEELWHVLGNSTFVSLERWPEPNGEMISDEIEIGEEQVDKVIKDAKQVIALMTKKSGKKAARATIVVAEEWKRTLTNLIVKEKDIGRALEGLQQDNTANMEAAKKYAGLMAKKVNELQEVKIKHQDEYDSFDQAKDYIAAQLGCEVIVEKEAQSKSDRAGKAMPMKPSIDIVFE